MNQTFRQDIDSIPTGSFSDMRERCRLRVLDFMKAQRASTHHCIYCNTLLLTTEISGFCCGKSNRKHWPWPKPSTELQRIYDTPGLASQARMLNSLFSSSVVYSSEPGHGFTYHTRSGPPTLRISGQLYNRMMRTADNCWFVHDASYPETFRRLSDRFQTIARSFRSLLLQSTNPYASIHNVPQNEPTLDNLQDGKVCLTLEPNAKHIFAVFVGPGGAPPARTLLHVGSRKAIQEEDPLWDLLAYPVFHPAGPSALSSVWQRGYKSMGTTTLTLLGYLRSVMFFEPNYWKCGRLAHQHLLDTWSRNEQILAKQWKSPAIQQRIRGYVDRIYGASSVHHGKIFLPASVPGSFRYQQRFFHDGLYIASKLGNPHLFITMTANPHWPEISELLRPGEIASDRLDLIARAFDLKRHRLVELLETENFLFDGHLGVEYMIWVTEWQLCGLPHLHMAVCLRSSISLVNIQDQLSIMDQVISATYPTTSGHDYDLVQTFMVHNDPCVVCLRDNVRTGTRECRFHYPKQPSNHPKIDSKGYPLYRRSQQDIRVVPHNIKLLRELMCHCNVEWTFACGCIAYLYKYFSKGCDSAGVKISDYADEIAAFRRARIVTGGEACYRTLGYRVNFRDPSVMLCKFSLPPDAVERARDEDKYAYDYIRGDPEGLLQDVAETDPTFDSNRFKPEHPEPAADDNDNLTSAVHGDLLAYFSRPVEIQHELTFTRFYEIFYMIPARRAHLYSEVTLSSCFIDIDGNFWKERDGRNRMFARMQWMSPKIGELYYLRKLLLQFPARSYDDVYRGFQSFKDSAEDAGLVDYEHESMYALLDATQEQFSSSMVRELFVTLMIHSGQHQMIHCWENHDIRTRIVHDFLPSHGEVWDEEDRVAQWLCLCDLVLIAYNMGNDVELSSYGLPDAPVSEEEVLTLLQRVGPHNSTLRRYMSHRSMTVQQTPDSIRIRVARDSLDEVRAHQSLPVDTEHELQSSISTLTTTEQLPLLNRLITMLNARSGGTLFVDAPAGCGKTYVNMIFLRYCHYHSIVALACATTGIAALQYTNGRTSHNLFQIFPEEDKQVIAGPKIQSRLIRLLEKGKTNARIELLRSCSVITWDEFPMAPKNVVEAVDRLLRLVKNRPNDPFGGILFVTLGDFRQVSPVNSDGAQRNQASPETAEQHMSFATSAFHDSIKSSSLWHQFAANTISLTENIRAKTDPNFHKKLMKIGNGLSGDVITVADLGLDVFYNLEDACRWVFEDISLDGDITLEPHYNPRDSSRRAILAPFNRDIDEVNRTCCVRYQQLYPDTQEIRLLSADTVEHDEDLTPPHFPKPSNDPELALYLAQQRSLDDAEAPFFQRPTAGLDEDVLRFDMGMLQEQKLDSSTFCEEVLHTLRFQGVPPHQITTWVGASIILLRNINPKLRLMNGSRMCLEWAHPNGRVISVRHADDSNLPSAPVFLLPRMRFPCKMNGFDARVTRKQFPIRQAYGMTIHKSQSATLDRVVVDLRHGVFDHGQLYVALSRVRNARDVRILINKGQEHLLNIVHAILLGR